MKSRAQRERDRLPHPIWRGVGVVMVVLIPIISFVISNELVIYWKNTIPGFILPSNLRQPLDIPLYGNVDNFLGVLALAVLITLAFFAVFSFVNAVVYSATREQNLRVFETPPRRYKRKRKLRKPKDRYKSKDNLF
jgi:hypothetical protein